jgi:hypothetical protein
MLALRPLYALVNLSILLKSLVQTDADQHSLAEV